MGVVESLAAWGIQRPAEVVQLAAKAGLEPAIAATLLEKESSGGKNVWGKDAVYTGGIYVKGAPVTRATYEAYRLARRAGQIKAQGVGPCQLTYQGFQDQADELGGCWDWVSNVTVGFRVLAGLQRQYGVRNGFRAYNGSGPPAETYADDAISKLARWRTRLGTAAATTSSTPSATPEKDWSDMATKDEIAGVVRAELATALQAIGWQTTGTLPNRRGEDGRAPAGAYVDTLWGYAMTAEGAAFRTEQLVRQLAARPGSPAAAGAPLSDADVDRVARRLRQLIFNQEV